MRMLLAALSALAVLPGGAYAQPSKPTVALVHGAFADGSSWNGVIEILEKDGYPVVAIANPLRGVARDGRYVADVVAGIASPVVLVGHSYGGSVISEAAAGRENVRALVFVAAFAPDVGESAADLAGRFPGSTLAATLASPVLLSDGGKDLYNRQDRFHAQFAADLPEAAGRLMAAAQRLIAEAALNEVQAEAAWKTIPSWFVYGDADRNIPPAASAFMAARAHARETVAIRGASHVVMVSHPEAVARLIERAASPH